MYEWRDMTLGERDEQLLRRFEKRHPWHSPPHRFLSGVRQYIVTAACYEHASIIGHSPERMTTFSDDLLGICKAHGDVYAWSVMPNHYHVLIQTAHSEWLCAQIGQLHGRSSFVWNGTDNERGRQVWYRCFEREMRSERHLWASINYVHHNPVKHGYASRWQDWRWSSATGFLANVGETRAREVWKEYPIRGYGKGWDD